MHSLENLATFGLDSDNLLTHNRVRRSYDKFFFLKFRVRNALRHAISIKSELGPGSELAHQNPALASSQKRPQFQNPARQVAQVPTKISQLLLNRFASFLICQLS